MNRKKKTEEMQPAVDESLLRPAEEKNPSGGRRLSKPDQGEDKTAEALDQLQKILHGLPAAVQEKMARLGVVLPAGNVREAVEGVYKYGLRCTQCNHIALYFVGTQFPDMNNDEVFDEPKPHMRTDQIAWTQDLPADKIDRVRPRCQHCSHRIEITGAGCFRMDRRLQLLKDWESTRDKSYSRSSLDKLRKKMAGASDAPMVQMPDGSRVALNDMLNRRSLERISDVIGKDAVDDIQELDKMFASQGGLLGALAAASRNR